MRQQTDTIGDMDDDGMDEAVAVSDRVKMRWIAAQLFMLSFPFLTTSIASSYNPDCGEIKEYRWTVCYTQNHTLTNPGNVFLQG